ncbi:metallophosphoesterase [Bacterioplanoides pacificum]|uniref:Metallophosphoesterase n=1 Tax=Bacterioplanoides pacificum TaxID=1171596 RepID=A0ABV7VRQ7_9GAMM
MSLVIVHLSDIHIEDERDFILSRSEKISRAIFKHAQDGGHVVLMISGDVANKGTREQYELAEKFLFSIKGNLEKERDVNIDFVICPGNHDCEFKSDPTRSFMIDKIIEDNVEEVDEEVILSCLNHQESYFEFENKISPESKGDKLWRQKEITYGGKVIAFESVNLSWCSKLRECQGELVYPFESYSKKMINEGCDYRILLMHHPLNWLLHSSGRSFRNSVRPMCNMVFTGHEHVPNAVDYSDIESGETSNFEASVLQDRSTHESGFSVIDFDVTTGGQEYSIYAYDLDSDMYIASQVRVMTGNEGFDNSLSFSEEFFDKVEDPGACFKNSNASNLRLSDIFVYQELKQKGKEDGGGKSTFQSSCFMIKPGELSKGTILSGEDNCGSSSLLYSLMLKYLNQGYMPVFIKGSNFKKSTLDNVNHQIKKAVDYQYGKDGSYEVFLQKERDKKILLIDDFNETKVKSYKGRESIFNHLYSSFDKVIVTVDKFFEVGELMSDQRRSVFSDFDHYEIEQFGYRKRTELINKWYTLGQLDSESEGDVVAKCTTAERLMDIVMDRSIVSPHPIFILTFLQSIEAGQASKLLDSALGDYYNFLLSQSYLDAGVGKDLIGQEFDYAMHLARFFNVRDTTSISKSEFLEFNDEFSKTWQEVDFSKKERLLLRAKVLVRNGDYYEFRYSYNYYFLIGRFMAKYILAEDVQRDVENYVKHLYVKKYANTILFLAHHASSDNILVLLKNAADNIFNDHEIANFNDENSIICELIRHAPHLEYSKKDPVESRMRLSEHRDSAIDQSEFERTEKFDDVANIDGMSKLTMLFKTIEILGEVLKANPTSFERFKKVEVLKSMFNAPLRALQDFYGFLEAHPNALVEAIENNISNKSGDISEGDREVFARLVVSQIIQAVSASFILRTAQVANSDALSADIPGAISTSNALSMELMGIAISLDNYKSIDRNKIGKFYRKNKDNMLVSKILNLLIINRLHLYKTSEQDMQWLQSELGYKLDMQHKIGYQKRSKKTKLVS